jgi:hypothetical protein
MINKETFYNLCLNLGVINQLIENGFMLDTENISLKGLAYVKEKTEIEDDFVEKYRKKFHKSNIGVSGKTGDYQGIKKKMSEFLKTYDYKEEDILKSVDNYIKDNKKNPIYIMEAHYFIKKDGVSKLASYCEDLKDSGNKVVNFFHE